MKLTQLNKKKGAIKMTENAEMRIKEIINKENTDADGIRVSVHGGGCSGLTYNLDLETENKRDG